MPDDVLGELTWAERSIIRRVRLGWTKSNLADRTGVSRVTLYLCMECKDRARILEPSARVRELVDQALAEGELQARQQLVLTGESS